MVGIDGLVERLKGLQDHGSAFHSVGVRLIGELESESLLGALKSGDEVAKARADWDGLFGLYCFLRRQRPLPKEISNLARAIRAVFASVGCNAAHLKAAAEAADRKSVV